MFYDTKQTNDFVMLALGEFHDALKAYNVAQRRFQEADGDTFELANDELSVAKERMRLAYLRMQEQMGV